MKTSKFGNSELVIKKKLKLNCACYSKCCWVSFEKGDDGELWVTLKSFLMEQSEAVILFREELEKLKEFLK